MYKPMETRDMALEIGRLIKLRKAVMDDNKMSMAAMGVGKSVAVDTIDNIIKYQKYGALDDGWEQMLRDGFAECMRVLKPDGVLIFKWSEVQIPADKVWRAIGQKPLFGHHSGKKMNTFWTCFMKVDGEDETNDDD